LKGHDGIFALLLIITGWEIQMEQWNTFLKKLVDIRVVVSPCLPVLKVD
jgi:hypothetical protein